MGKLLKKLGQKLRSGFVGMGGRLSEVVRKVASGRVVRAAEDVIEIKVVNVNSNSLQVDGLNEVAEMNGSQYHRYDSDCSIKVKSSISSFGSISDDGNSSNRSNLMIDKTALKEANMRTTDTDLLTTKANEIEFKSAQNASGDIFSRASSADDERVGIPPRTVINDSFGVSSPVKYIFYFNEIISRSENVGEYWVSDGVESYEFFIKC
jgi:hypothetical protein